jgi:mycoredoxin
MSTRFTMYSTSWCGYCHRLSSQLRRDGLRAGVDFHVVDIEHQPEAAGIVASANHGNRTVPTLVFADGTSMTNPSIAQVKAKIGS